MIDLEVLPPTKTDTRYAFECRVRHAERLPRELLRRVRAAVRGSGYPPVIRFGFEALNFTIRHHAVWDAVYPLMFLTRNGGPLFHRGHDRAAIRFAYPISEPVRDFYVRRAADMGIAIEVEADTDDARCDEPTDGHVVAFGGGKDSRLVVGILQEAGAAPIPVTAGAANAPDLPGARITRPVNGVLADRVMPALMARGRHFYFGSGLGEAHRETPWHQYFDLASPPALAEMSRLLGDLGLETELHAPASILPYNLIQRILFERYPASYAHQRSVEPDERSEKNLHVALCELHHGIPFAHHCRESLFRDLLDEFVRHQIAKPLDFGYRNHREPIRREMRAIIARHRERALFEPVRAAIPAEWDGAWIDYVHTYVAPDVPAHFLRIYAQYAPSVDQAPAGSPIWRIAV